MGDVPKFNKYCLYGFTSSVPIYLILSEVSGEVKQRTNYTLTNVQIKNESMIRISPNLSLMN